MSQGRQARPKEKESKGKGNSADVRIETEFPAAGNTSPKAKRVAVFERRARSLERNATNRITSNWYSASPSAIVAAMAGGKGTKGGNRSRRGSESNEKSCFPPSRLKQSTSADAISHFGVAKKMTPSQSQILSQVARWKNLSPSQDRLAPQTLLRTLSKDEGPAVFLAGKDFDHQSFEAFNKNFEKLLAKNSTDDPKDPIWVSGSSKQKEPTHPALPVSSSTSLLQTSSTSSLSNMSQTAIISTTTSEQHLQRQPDHKSKIPASSKPKENQKTPKTTVSSGTKSSSSFLSTKPTSSSPSTSLKPKTSTSSASSVSSVQPKQQQQQQQQQQRHDQLRKPGPSQAFLAESSKNQSKKQSNRSHYAAPLRDPFASHKESYSKTTSASPYHPYYYYYDYSDEDSDSRPVSRDFSSASTMSLNEILDSSMEGEVALDDDFFSDWSSIRLTPGKRSGDYLTGAAISNKAIEAGNKGRTESSSSSGRSRSTSSSPEMSLPGALKNSNAAARNLAAASVLALQEARLKQAVLAATKGNNGIPINPAQNPTTSLSRPFSSTGQTSSAYASYALPSSPRSEQDKVQTPIVSRNVSQQARTRILESSSSPRFPHSSVITKQVIADVHSEALPPDNKDSLLPLVSPSPCLSQRSQDQGYSSKGSYSQSSPSPSPSMSHRGTVTPPWLHSTKDPHSFTRNELLSLVINREAVGSGQKTSISSSTTDDRTSPNSTPKLRPGQLILAPQDKSFSFNHGFSSASSGSSDDKSPTKMFSSSQQNMESSVIEVKQDGSHVYTPGCLVGASSTTASSITNSSCSSSVTSSAASSPIKSPSGSKVPPPVAKKPTRAVKPEARVAPSSTKSSDNNSSNNSNNNNNNTSNNNNNNDTASSRNAVKDSSEGDNSSHSGHRKPNSSDITVGFMLHDQIFPPSLASKTDVVEDFLLQALKGTTHSKQNSLNIHHGSSGLTNHCGKQASSLKTPSGSSNSSPYQTKCQSSDSSFENLRVERSGSKDDGYSTMSSDIHPEILDKFADDISSTSFVRGTTSCEAVDVFHEDEVTTDDSSTGEGTLVLVKEGSMSKGGSPRKKTEKFETSTLKDRNPQDSGSSNHNKDKTKGVSSSLLLKKEVSKEVSNQTKHCAIKTKTALENESKTRTSPTAVDQSSELTSDADSALETSAHSTDTTATVSSSPCHSLVVPSSDKLQPSEGGGKPKQMNKDESRCHKVSTGRVGVSKLTKIFDVKTKSSANSAPSSKCNSKSTTRGASIRSDNKPSSNPPISSNPLKSLSRLIEPAAVSNSGSTKAASLQASNKQNDSPKRLANQFLKKAATGVSKTCRKITSTSSTAAAMRPQIKHSSQQQKSLEEGQTSPKTNNVVAEPRTGSDAKKPPKYSSSNSLPGNRLRFGFSNNTKSEKSASPKKATNSPPSSVPQQQTKKSAAVTTTTKRGLKFLSSSCQQSSNGIQGTNGKDASLKKDSNSREVDAESSSNVKTSKLLRPLSADYASSISNINEIPYRSGECNDSKVKRFEKQRPYSICSDRDVIKNGPLRIIMTNHAFQQHSSSDSDSDADVKLATFSFVKPATADYSNFYNNVLNTSSLRDSNSKSEDQLALPNKTGNNNHDSEGSCETPSQITTKIESASCAAHTESICTSTFPISSSVSSMQACTDQQPNASATKSSNENVQQVQHQSSNFSSNMPCQEKPASTSLTVHPDEILDMFCPRPTILRKSKSEHSLSMKPASTTAFDDFFGCVWDSGKMLERSASVSELDLLSKRDGSFFEIDDLNASFEGWDRPSSSEVRFFYSVQDERAYVI